MNFEHQHMNLQENCIKETSTQRKRRLLKAKQKYIEKRAVETQFVKRLRLQQRRSHIVHESLQRRQTRLQTQRIRQAQNRLHETAEQREVRLQFDRVRHARIRVHQTVEQLELDCARHALTRAQEINCFNTIFENAIYKFCDRVCEICHKLCYPNQISKVSYNLSALSYLPHDLTLKSLLFLCSRCRKHVVSNKTQAPSNSYWNNLDPGIIPQEILILTQAEQRLLSRIVPFIKVVKFSGMFGQYGFRGQAVLFAQDIFEVTETLTNSLPRSVNETGLVLVTEHLENVNVTREFSISRERVFNALRWLILNNPLYKDVIIDQNVCINEQDMVRVNMPQEIDHSDSDPDPDHLQHLSLSAYKPINNIARIVRASWHQADTRIFKSGYAGLQCCTMALANIIRAEILNPARWSTITLDTNMIEGDALYGIIRHLTSPNVLHPSGYLEVKNFDIIHQNVTMFNDSFSICYEDDPSLFGSLQDKMNKDFGLTLRTALNTLFLNHSAGILIANSKAQAIMHYNDKYYFSDSHSCGRKGVSAANGRACIIQCDTIEELHRICKRCTGSRNMNFTINYIDVHRKQNFVRNSARTIEKSQTEVTEFVQVIEAQQPHIASIQTSIMLPIDYVQPDVEDELHISDYVYNIRRKTTDNIVNEAYELKAEEFAWFFLFPFGINGFKQERLVRLTPLDYYQSRILGSELRFQRNDYLFYALSMFEYYRVKTTIAACGRKVQDQHGSKIEDLHLYMKNLRGSAAYWRTALNDLIAQIRCLGPPNYFLTFSCNDLNWLDMRKALLIADGRPDEDPNNLDLNSTQRLIELYPVIVSRHFMIRLNALMRFLKHNFNVFHGRVKDYWWRIEFQNRGSPHVHMVIWIEGHPSIEASGSLEIIDEVCSCEMPVENSDLYHLVKKCQVHQHTTTCWKKDTSSTECRFNFPREICAETHIVEPSSDEFIRQRGRICVLKRRYEDRWINTYNPTLLKLWKGNMDIQPCGSNESIAYYIAKYISKCEPTDLDAGIRDAIRQIRNEETDVSRKLFKICMRIMKERQVSACECVFRLCHLKMRDSSRSTVFLNTRKPEERYKVLSFDRTGRADGYFANIFDRYEKRPIEHTQFDFNNMNILKFAMLFEPYYAKSSENNDIDIDEDAYGQQDLSRRQLIKLIDNSKMVVRSTPAVIRVPYFVAATDPEHYFYSLLLQYMPYRHEHELLANFNNAQEAFLAREELLKDISKEMELYRQRDKQLEQAFNQVHAFQILEEVEPFQLDEEEEELPLQCMNDNDFYSAQRTMTVGQRDMFTMVTRSIREQLSGENERLRIFFTGGAGVGKTFLLNLLRHQINRCYGTNAVKVTALTGVAARLVNGSTIHSTLKLPVQKDGRITGMSPLTGNYLTIMRREWRDIHFLIIDEISMVSYEMFCMIDSRLRELKNKDNEFFGDLNILLFGDLMQLPPIKTSGKPIYKQPKHLQPATHLWRLFRLCELTDNMRQQDDKTFIDLLNALRIGAMTSQHFVTLTRHLLEEPTGDFAIDKALRVYPTNKQVHDHNTAVLQHFKDMNVTIYTVEAQDELVDNVRNLGNFTLEDIIPSDINKTGGLPKVLHIFVGAKVMLRSNIDVSKGLVNGAIGYILEIVWPYFRREQIYQEDIPSVRIDFGIDGVHLIQPKVIQFPAKFSYGTAQRRMLPLILSWASTVHKMQGCTVDCAVVYLGSKLFEEGQAYVALSRVRSLEGLRIEELDCSKLTGTQPCNKEALAELERMRNCTRM